MLANKIIDIISNENDYLFENYFGLLNITGRYQSLYKKLAGDRYIDLLFHLPNNCEERTHQQFISSLEHNELATMNVRVVSHEPTQYGSRRPYKIACSDGQHRLELVFFKAQSRYLERVAPLGETICVSGKVARSVTGIQIYHPDHIGPVNTLQNWVGISPIYPLTAGLTVRVLQSHINTALRSLKDTPEWLPKNIIDQYGFSTFTAALKSLHKDVSPENIDPLNIHRKRLAFDEILAQQLALVLSREDRPEPIPTMQDATYSPRMNQLIESLPYTLTQCQTNAVADILGDFSKSGPMLRLIQGDVGSGKTLVGLLTSLHAIDQGKQVAFLVPTEILARQHYENIKKLTEHLNINVGVLISKDTTKSKRTLNEGLESGEVNLVIGTHALIQENVSFKNLGLVIIDEQHRFGVEQRLKLSDKGIMPHVLSMTATPIPRTLTLAQYGDMDVSVIRQKPPGRKPIITKLISLERLSEVLDSLQKRINMGDKFYWVCPLIEESETSDMAAAVSRYDDLSKTFGNRVGLIHGKMSPAQKQETMDSFIKGDIQILVSTTVIEVGVDVKDATIMIIEQAERFGLSQLHQLRGRVGRGEKPSICLLLFGQKLTFQARKRLEAMRDTEDGFVLAEADLRLRGGGEITGTRQSGLPQLKFADLQAEENELYDLYSNFLETAHKYALEIAAEDQELSLEKHAPLRLLLKIFKRDRAIAYKRSG